MGWQGALDGCRVGLLRWVHTIGGHKVPILVKLDWAGRLERQAEWLHRLGHQILPRLLPSAFSPWTLSASFSSSIVANCDSPKISSHHPRLRSPINTKSTKSQHPVGTDTRASTKSNGHWRSGRESGVCQAGACVHCEQRAASTLNQKEADLGSCKFGNF